jgi:hypothetical protein
MMNNGRTETQSKRTGTAAPQALITGETFMKSVLMSVLAVVVLSATSFAKDPLPEAPSATASAEGFFIEPVAVKPAATFKPAVETKTIDSKFVALAIISTGATFSDSYTTLFARENWLAGKQGVCNMEVQSAYLYGTHPTVARAYAVASIKSSASILAAYYLRKHHNKFWAAPLLTNSAISLEGVTQNMRECN